MAGGFDFEVPFRPSTPFRRWFAGKRADVALGFEPLERRVDRADRNLPTRSIFNLAAHRHPVRIGAQPHDGEHHDLFERAEKVSTRHLFYKIRHTGRQLSSPLLFALLLLT